MEAYFLCIGQEQPYSSICTVKLVLFLNTKKDLLTEKGPLKKSCYFKIGAIRSIRFVQTSPPKFSGSRSKSSAFSNPSDHPPSPAIYRLHPLSVPPSYNLTEIPLHSFDTITQNHERQRVDCPSFVSHLIPHCLLLLQRCLNI